MAERSLHWLPLAIALSVAPLGACGGGNGAIRPTSQFTAEHAESFEDGIDFYADPELLEGRWREDWTRDIQKRVGWSDLIAIVSVSTLRTDIDPERRTTFRIVAKIDRVILGEAPADDELVLPVREGQPGFVSVEGHDQRILNHQFVLYTKWYLNEIDEIAPHWHLSPATPAIVRRTEYLAARRDEAVAEQPRRTVVEHEN